MTKFKYSFCATTLSLHLHDQTFTSFKQIQTPQHNLVHHANLSCVGCSECMLRCSQRWSSIPRRSHCWDLIKLIISGKAVCVSSIGTNPAKTSKHKYGLNFNCLRHPSSMHTRTLSSHRLLILMASMRGAWMNETFAVETACCTLQLTR